MQVEFAQDGERLVARPSGPMNAADGDAFADAVRERIGAATKAVTIDLDRLDMVAFGGIRALLRLARTLKEQDRSLDFLAGNELVRESLDQAGLDDFFPFTPPYITSRGAPK